MSRRLRWMLGVATMCGGLALGPTAMAQQGQPGTQPQPGETRGAERGQEGREGPRARARAPQSAEQVLNGLHQLNQMEIRMGQMAQERAQSDQVRNYAERLVRDHQQLDQQVQQLAEQREIELREPGQNGMGGGQGQPGQQPGQAQPGARGGQQPGQAQPGAQAEGRQQPGQQPGARAQAPRGQQQKHGMHGMQQDMEQRLQRLQQAEGQQFDRLFLNTQLDAHRKGLQMLRQARQVEDPQVRQLVDQAIPVMTQHQQQAQALLQQLRAPAAAGEAGDRGYQVGRPEAPRGGEGEGAAQPQQPEGERGGQENGAGEGAGADE